jgi:beta-lactamase superfamily II metal-dependent hydrolase
VHIHILEEAAGAGAVRSAGNDAALIARRSDNLKQGVADCHSCNCGANCNIFSKIGPAGRGRGEVNCEIEFLAVGAGSKAGDAIIARYGEKKAYELMLIDGGTADTGDKIVAHLKKYFGQTALEHVLLTHSDADHASGLRTVLNEIPVKNLWLHLPWFLSADAIALFKDKRWTKDGLQAAIKKEYDIIGEIFDIACARGCQVYYPFQGNNIGPFRILSPSQYAYLHLLPQFEKTPDADQSLIEAASIWVGKASMMQKLLELAKAKVESWTTETWNQERLKDGGATSASNESSVVLYGSFGESARVLLTGDAGVRALTWAADYAVSVGLPLQQFSFVQIPHHGSRRNVGPTILTRLLGPIQPEGSKARFRAFVSAPADDDTHPRRIVLNAFKRRGCKIISTQGSNKIHYGGFPKRDDYSDAEELPFYTKVEEYT